MTRTPTLDGLRTLEMLLVSQQAGVIRWIPPMLFQALCDFIGLLGQTLFDRDIAWALCEPATPASHPSTQSPSTSPAGGLTEGGPPPRRPALSQKSAPTSATTGRRRR